MFDDLEHGLTSTERDALRSAPNGGLRDPRGLEDKIVGQLRDDGWIVPASQARWVAWVKGLAVAAGLVASFGLGMQFGGGQTAETVEPVLQSIPADAESEGEFVVAVDPRPSNYPVNIKEWLNHPGSSDGLAQSANDGSYSPAFIEPNRDMNASR